MADTWKDYQFEVSQFFTGLGFEADTDVRLQGVRTRHDIDVVVRSQHAGFTIMWLLECKHWQTRVSKLHVLALREIVADTGADRGILLCEAGFQIGAIEAAALTNVQLTSLANVQQTARFQILAMRLHELYDRIETCRKKYWDIPKDERVKYGLRCDVPDFGYSGARVIDVVAELVTKALRGVYPIECESIFVYVTKGFPRYLDGPEKVIAVAEPLIVELEGKIADYDSMLVRRRKKSRQPNRNRK